MLFADGVGIEVAGNVLFAPMTWLLKWQAMCYLHRWRGYLGGRQMRLSESIIARLSR